VEKQKLGHQELRKPPTVTAIANHRPPRLTAD